jgi:hypothetical protein
MLTEKHYESGCGIFLGPILEFVKKDHAKPIMAPVTISTNAVSHISYEKCACLHTRGSPDSVLNFRFLVFDTCILKLTNKLHDRNFLAFYVP